MAKELRLSMSQPTEFVTWVETYNNKVSGTTVVVQAAKHVGAYYKVRLDCEGDSVTKYFHGGDAVAVVADYLKEHGHTYEETR